MLKWGVFVSIVQPAFVPGKMFGTVKIWLRATRYLLQQKLQPKLLLRQERCGASKKVYLVLQRK